MKKLLCLAAAMAISTAANATKFEFSWNGDYGYNVGSKLVTGTFEGTANGNVITDLSNISVFINGVAFNSNGSLYGSSLQNYWGWQSGGAQASFDGTQNNFLFIDSDYPNNYSYTNYFYSVYGGQSSFAYNGNNWNYEYVSGSTNASNWSVTSTEVPEPAPLALLGLGLVALARFRKKSA